MARKLKPEDNGTSKTSTPRKLLGTARISFLVNLSPVDSETLKDEGVTTRDQLAEWTKDLFEAKLIEKGGPRKNALLKARHADMLREIKKIEEQLGDELD